MVHRLSPAVAALALTAAFAYVPTAQAIITYDNAGQNSSPAPGSVDQYVGNYNGGSAVLVAPDVVLTTLHLGPSTAGTFVYQGQSYGIDKVQTIGDTQIAVMHLTAPTGSTGVQLYSGAGDATAQVVLVGYGGPKGTPFTGNSASQTGWNWTGGVATTSWGQATNDNIYADASNATYLGFAFTATPGSSMFTGGDSGGGMFINDNGTWKLAGLNWSVDGYYGAPNDPVVNEVAAIYDVPGSALYTVDNHGSYLLATAAQHGYSSRIADPATYATLQNTIASFTTVAVPEPSSLLLLTLGAPALLRRRRASRA